MPLTLPVPLRHASLLLVACASACTLTPPEEDPLYLKISEVDSRLVRVERVIDNQGLMTLLSRLEEIQRDVQALRNDVETLQNQTDALRLVAFVDRLYDAQVRIYATGVPLDEVFGDEMLAGGYRKKYLRATSRMIALTSAALDDVATVDAP